MHERNPMKPNTNSQTSQPTQSTQTTKYLEALTFYSNQIDTYNCAKCEFSDQCQSHPDTSHCHQIRKHAITAVEALLILISKGEEYDKRN